MRLAEYHIISNGAAPPFYMGLRDSSLSLLRAAVEVIAQIGVICICCGVGGMGNRQGFMSDRSRPPPPPKLSGACRTAVVRGRLPMGVFTQAPLNQGKHRRGYLRLSQLSFVLFSNNFCSASTMRVLRAVIFSNVCAALLVRGEGEGYVAFVPHPLSSGLVCSLFCCSHLHE